MIEVIFNRMVRNRTLKLQDGVTINRGNKTIITSTSGFKVLFLI